MRRIKGVAGVICLFAIWFVCFGGTAQADVVINEVMSSNGYYENGHAWDWVELYNNGKETVNLSGWGFTDSKKDLYKFTFPDGAKLKAGDYLTIWCTGEENKTPGKGDTFYADFKISSSGETLRLTDRDEEEIQKLKMPEQYGCISYGMPSGGGARPASMRAALRWKYGVKTVRICAVPRTVRPRQRKASSFRQRD